MTPVEYAAKRIRLESRIAAQQDRFNRAFRDDDQSRWFGGAKDREACEEMRKAGSNLYRLRKELARLETAE